MQPAGALQLGGGVLQSRYNCRVRLVGPGVHCPIEPRQVRWERCCSCPLGAPSLRAVGKFGLRSRLLFAKSSAGSAPAFQDESSKKKPRRDHLHVPLGTVVERSAIYFAV